MPKNAKISELTLSRTQIHDYLGCGQKWKYVYKDGIIPAGIREALDQGSCVHLCVKTAILTYATRKWGRLEWDHKQEFMALMLGAKKWAAEEKKKRGIYLTPEQETQIREIKAASVGIAQKALEHIDLPSWDIFYWKGKPLCEVEVITALPPWKGFRTIPDLVARKRGQGVGGGGWWLIDWKVRGSFEQDDAEDINLQFSSMQYVLQTEMNLDIEGSLLWQIKDSPPRQPNLNKNGSMSRADVVTDWETYRQALLDNGLDPKDYTDMEVKLSQKLWFKAIKQHRTFEECARVWREIVEPASDVIVRTLKGDLPVIRRWLHQPFACKGCWARELCMAELYDQDTEFLLQTSYIDTRNPRKRMEMGEPTRQFKLTEG